MWFHPPNLSFSLWEILNYLVFIFPKNKKYENHKYKFWSSLASQHQLHKPYISLSLSPPPFLFRSLLRLLDLSSRLRQNPKSQIFYFYLQNLMNKQILTLMWWNPIDDWWNYIVDFISFINSIIFYKSVISYIVSNIIQLYKTYMAIFLNSNHVIHKKNYVFKLLQDLNNYFLRLIPHFNHWGSVNFGHIIIILSSLTHNSYTSPLSIISPFLRDLFGRPNRSLGFFISQIMML